MTLNLATFSRIQTNVIYANYISDKGLVYRIHKELRQLFNINKKTTNSKMGKKNLAPKNNFKKFNIKKVTQIKTGKTEIQCKLS